MRERHVNLDPAVGVSQTEEIDIELFSGNLYARKNVITRRDFLKISALAAGAGALVACGGSKSGSSNQELGKSAPSTGNKDLLEGNDGEQEIDDQDYGEEMDLLTDTIREARVVTESRARIDLAPDAFTKVDFGIAWRNGGLSSLTGTNRLLINVYKEEDGEQSKNTIKIKDGEEIVVEDIDFTNKKQRVTFRMPEGFTLTDTPWRNYFKENGQEADSRVEIDIITQEAGTIPGPENKQDGKIG